jgi:hypothetical protein
MIERIIGSIKDSLRGKRPVEAAPVDNELVQQPHSWEEQSMVREALEPRPASTNDIKPMKFMGVSIPGLGRSIKDGGGEDVELRVKIGELIMREKFEPPKRNYAHMTMANALGPKAAEGRNYKDLSGGELIYVAEFALGRRQSDLKMERRRTFPWERSKNR